MQILIETLDKKIHVLQQLIVQCNKQEQIVTANEVDWDSFDRLVDSKATLIEELSRLDDGFEVTFARVKDDLLSNQEKYRTEVGKMQDKIREITDLSTQLQNVEYHNKTTIEKAFANTRDKIRDGRRSSKVAMGYYQKMSQVNYIDPQLMDRKS